MKRVTSGCLFQTLHFVLDSHYSKEEALDKVKKKLKIIKIKILRLLVKKCLMMEVWFWKLKKRVSGYPTGEYFE